VRPGADILQPDVGRTGISELIKIARMAEAFNIPVAPHQSVGLGVCNAASIHAAAAIPNLYMLEYQPPVFELANALLETPLVCREGQFHLPGGAGLGVQVDERKLRDLQA
jgi:L-alanine-DL-glutamate epimerase-like enolase superfamily enzyme